MRSFVFSPFYSTTFPSVDEFVDYIKQFGAKLVAYNVTDIIYFMVQFDEENDTFRAWSDIKDSDARIRIGEEGRWWLYS